MSSENLEPSPKLAPTKRSSVAPPKWLWPMVLAAGIAAGVVSWLGGEKAFGYFKPQLGTISVMGTTFEQATAESEAATEVKNAALAFAILGGVLGLAFGLAGGLARGNVRAALVAGTVGLALGAGVGVGTSLGIVPAYKSLYNAESEDLIGPLLSHGGIWGAIGAAGGFAFGIGLGGRGQLFRGLVGGLVGALVGTIAYELAGAAVFPLDRTFQPLSKTPYSRLLARMAVGLCAAVGAAIAVNVAGPKSSSSATTSS